MEVIPAIDLRGGQCVRLYQGEYDRATVFDPDPVAVTRRWLAAGARRLHLVDLDGAFQGSPHNRAAVEAIAQVATAPIQLGGGIRDRATAAAWLDRGVDRVILGTLAIEQPDVAAGLLADFGDRILVSLDARNGFVTTRGWTETSALRLEDALTKLVDRGLRRVVYTDISRDGTLSEPNFAAIESLVKVSPIPVIASGGVARPDHLDQLRAIGVEAVIVGKALYTGDIPETVLRGAD
ncbi:MAG TPA: 1-(5-phosphoribosyl)-5-[(5-phosphoribosylamino)methylideneamino]imidazole-4-carboxamide isomerase [Dehalococcoidia bacterium]|nr:1-(5-phosphoribosyl)-5-[(5-phosphoribosylamino)methylideneamino]imidazole-4-carboxamide isomerase [Dehalococcoidia bacterium]